MKKLLSIVLIGLLQVNFAFMLRADAVECPCHRDIGAELGFIHVLNTGWEDAIVLESDGHFALVDAGMIGRGPYIVNYLQRRAGSVDVHLDFIIVTHAHIDHISGFEYIIGHPNVTIDRAYLKRKNVETYVCRCSPSWGYCAMDLYLSFIENSENNGITLILDDLDNRVLELGYMNVTLVNGEPLIGGTTNPESLCQLIEVGDFRALLLADVTGEAAETRIFNQVNGTVDFFKVGHHGLRGSTGVRLARNLRPAVAVYTNGSSWEVDSHDITLGSDPRGIEGFNHLRRVGTVQYVAGDNGGVMAVFGEYGMEYRAIREFVRSGPVLDFEYREDIVLRPMTPPTLTFFQRVSTFFGDVWYSFIGMFGR
ncbi:MAG: MBL fold metallo-hydrolase [Oscillospiraceae bacterium]|nr:MBL fold metallo-hydrolase [Oscillospiraceae bacterium]